MAMGDQVGKAAADEFAAQIPGLEQFIDLQLAKLQATFTQIVADAKAEIEKVVGDSLAAITAERTEAVSQITDSVHAVMDRVQLQVQILPRKA